MNYKKIKWVIAICYYPDILLKQIDFQLYIIILSSMSDSFDNNMFVEEVDTIYTHTT